MNKLLIRHYWCWCEMLRNSSSRIIKIWGIRWNGRLCGISTKINRIKSKISISFFSSWNIYLVIDPTPDLILGSLVGLCGGGQLGFNDGTNDGSARGWGRNCCGILALCFLCCCCCCCGVGTSTLRNGLDGFGIPVNWFVGRP